MNILVIILSFAFIALELYMVWYVGKKMIIVKKLSLKDTIIYPLVVVLAAVTLMIARGYYLKADAVDNIPASLKDSVSIVALSINTDLIKKLWDLKQFDSSMLVIVYCVEYLVSILALISISLSIILVTIVNKARCVWYKFHKFDEIDYIIGFNEDSKKYIKNYCKEYIDGKKSRGHKTYVVLDNSGIDKNEDKKFYLNKNRMPYIEFPCNDKNNLEKLLNKFTKKSKKRVKKFIVFIEDDKLLFDFVKLALNKVNERVEFVILANSEQENFLNNLLVTSKEDRNEEINNDCDRQDRSSGRIRIVNKYDLIAQEFVQNHNFAKYFEPSLLNDDLTVKDCDINLYVLGFGKVNQAVLRDTLICNQFVQKVKKGEKLVLAPKRMNVKIYELNETVDCFELINGLFKYDKAKYNQQNYLNLPEDYVSNVEIKSNFSIYANDFIKLIFKEINDKCQDRNQMNYFLISIDSDFSNSDIALKLRDNLNHIVVLDKDNNAKYKAYNRFFIRNKEQGYDEKAMIYAFGTDEDVLKYENVVGTAAIDLAIKYEAEYQNLAGYDPSWDTLTPFKRKSNIYSVLALYFKMSLIALKKARKANEPITIDDISKLLAENYEIDSANKKGENFEALYKNEATFDVRDVYAFIEHEKWNAFELSQGALPMSKQFVNKLTKDNKNKKIIKNTPDELYHLAITTHAGLRDYYDFINELLKKNEGYKGDPNVLRYDYYHMDLIKEDLEGNKVFKKIYENLIEYLNNQN